MSLAHHVNWYENQTRKEVRKAMVKRLLFLLALAGGVFLTLDSQVNAALIENAYLQPSNPVTGTSGVSHTVRFFHPSDTMGSLELRYCTTPSQPDDSCVPGVGAGSPAITTLTVGGGDDSGNWSVAWDSTDTITLTRTSANTSADDNWVFTYSNMNNPAFGTCSYTTNSETGTCYVRVTSYADTNTTTTADTGIISLTVTQAVAVTARVDPTFTFRIAGIDPTATTAINGVNLTSGITPTVTTLPFGNLTAGTAKYLGHSLTVSTNTSKGYSITARMTANMTGSAYLDDIDQFNDGTATSSNANVWSSPTGTTSGTDTGWLGVGTDDTHVTGYASTEFFPLGTTAQTVATQSTSVASEVDNLIFAIEVNTYQEADSYSGTMRYVALPVY